MQEYWSGFPCPPPGNLLHLGIKPGAPVSPALQVGFFFFFFTTDANCEAPRNGCQHARSLESFLTLSDPMDCSPPGSSVRGIFQARILEWVARPSSRGSFWPRDRTCHSCNSCIVGRFFTAEPPGKHTLLFIGCKSNGRRSLGCGPWDP